VGRPQQNNEFLLISILKIFSLSPFLILASVPNFSLLCCVPFFRCAGKRQWEISLFKRYGAAHQQVLGERGEGRFCKATERKENSSLKRPPRSRFKLFSIIHKLIATFSAKRSK
jgi:hypothetical protein